MIEDIKIDEAVQNFILNGHWFLKAGAVVCLCINVAGRGLLCV
jgi:hypothetical protein